MEATLTALPLNTLPMNTLPMSRLPTSAMPIRALESELVGLAGHLAAGHCRWLQLLSEFDDRDGWAGPGLRTCAHWLSWRVGMNVRTAFEQLRVAHALNGLPSITAAFAAGQISYSKVRAITRIATADTEQVLLDLALAGTAGHVERVVRATRQAQADPAQTHAGRRLEWNWDDDGTLLVRARFTPEQGAALLTALARETDRPAPGLREHAAQERVAASDRTAPRLAAGHAECSAEHSAVPELAFPAASEPASAAAESEAADAVTALIEPLAARRADALIELLVGTAGAGHGASGGVQVVLHISTDPEADPEADPGSGPGTDPATDAGQATARIENGPSVPLASAERIACAARVRALVKDRRGNPLYLGRTHRLVTKKLFAAVSIRDRHRCRWVGCTETRHLDAHHIRHWLRGGRTDIHNLALLCDFHHRLIHDHGYRMRGTGNDVTFHRPDGRLIPAAGPPTEGRLQAVYDVSAAQGATITDDTITPTWAGERLDPTPILALLLPERTSAAAA